LPSGTRILGRGFTFQQDNDPKHISHLCKNYLARKKRSGAINIMEWPPQSPDLSPIELLWDELDRAVRKLNPTGAESMWNTLQTAWNKITPQTLEKLVARMPRLCAAVIAKKGGHIDERL
jgi:hypothetical protein